MEIEDEELETVTVISKDKEKKVDLSIRRIKPGGVLVEPTINLMVKHFIPRETMNSFLGFTSEQDSINSLEQAWRQKIAEGNSIVAILNQQDDGITVVGANITYVVNKHEDELVPETGGNAIKTIGKIIQHITESCDVNGKYKVEKYLSAMGLTVDPKYNGLGIGEIILKSRKELCKRIGLTCSATIFTGYVSQHLASKVGFETIYQIKYNDVIVNDKNVFPTAPPDLYLKQMARTYTF